MTPDTPECIPAFLLTLEHAVAEDDALSGLRGDLCVAVGDSEQRAWWWHARFGDKATSAFVVEPVAGATTLMIGEETARVMLTTGQLPPMPSLRSSGDLGLIERFVRRYLVTQGVVGVRSGSGATGTKSKRRKKRSRRGLQ